MSVIAANIRTRIPRVIYSATRSMSAGEKGSGVGFGGGTGGSIRDAGGAFGKMEAAREDEYFYKQQKEQLANLKESLKSEVKFHEEQIELHKNALKRHKERIDKMDD